MKKYFLFHFKARHKGFTLLEILVSLGLILVAVSIALPALLVLEDANRRAQTSRRAVDNVTFAIEDIVRTARSGKTYHCGAVANLSSDLAINDTTNVNYVGNPLDCVNGGTYLALEKNTGDPKVLTDQVIYRLNNSTLEKSVDGGATFLPLTSTTVSIQALKFYVIGSGFSDNFASRILLTLKAITDPNTKSATPFNLQTTIGQRQPDY